MGTWCTRIINNDLHTVPNHFTSWLPNRIVVPVSTTLMDFSPPILVHHSTYHHKVSPGSFLLEWDHLFTLLFSFIVYERTPTSTNLEPSHNPGIRLPNLKFSREDELLLWLHIPSFDSPSPLTRSGYSVPIASRFGKLVTLQDQMGLHVVHAFIIVTLIVGKNPSGI